MSKQSFLSRTSLKLTRLINSSLFSRAVFCYPKENAAVQNGLFAAVKQKLGLKDASKLRFKMRVNTLLHSSASQTLYSRLIRFLLTSRLRSLGTFCFLFGFLNCAFFFARRLIEGNSAQNAPTLIFGVCLTLASLPLFSARSTIASALWRGRASGWFLQNAVGLREDEMPAGSVHSGEIFAVTAALVSGIVSYFTGPFLFCLILLCVLFAALCLYKPEFGLTLSLFLFPFFKANTLAILFGFVFLCFLIKLLCGKRAVRFELTDGLFCLLLLFLALSGVFASFPSNTGWPVYCVLGLVYFLISFLGKSQTLIRRFMLAFALGTALCAALHLLFTLVTVPEFLELSALSRTAASFASPMLLCAGAPLFASLSLTADRAGKRIVCFLLLLLMLADLWFFSSLSAYLALGAALVVLLTLYKRTYFFFFLALGVALAIALPLIPGEQTTFLREAFSNRAPSLLSLNALPSSAYFCGFGVYDTETLLSLSAISASPDSLTLTMQVLLSSGLVGLLLWALFLAACAQKAMWVYLSLPRLDKRLYSIAPLCSVFALLLLGVAQNVGADPRAIALFSLLCALSNASSGALIGFYPSAHR